MKHSSEKEIEYNIHRKKEICKLPKRKKRSVCHFFVDFSENEIKIAYVLPINEKSFPDFDVNIRLYILFTRGFSQIILLNFIRTG